MSKTWLREYRLPQKEIQRIYVDWVPRSGEWLCALGDGVKIDLGRGGEDSANLCRAIGSVIPEHVIDRGRARELFFYPSDHRPEHWRDPPKRNR